MCRCGAEVSVTVHRGDITQHAADVLVNSTNPALAPGAGVAGAFYRAGGEAMHEEMRRAAPLGLHTGEFISTGSHGLPCKHIIHVVSHRWVDRAGRNDDLEERMWSMYADVFRYARDELGAASIATPSLGTGIFRVPLAVAVRAFYRAAKAFPDLDIRLVAFDEDTYRAYAEHETRK